MAIDVNWFNDDKTIVQLVLRDPWDWPEFEQRYFQGLELTTAVDYPVYCIVEFSGKGRRPQGNALMHLKRMSQQTRAYPNAAACFLVNPHPFARSLIGLLVRVYGQDPNLIVTGNVDDVLRRIKAMRQGS